jgi:hypothetical protein
MLSSLDTNLRVAFITVLVQVLRVFGEPISAYCDGYKRRNQIASVEEEVDGVLHIRINYYVEGPLAKGSVFVEVGSALQCPCIFFPS